MHFLLSSMSVVYVLTTPIPEDGENATVEQLRKRAKWDNDDYVCRGLTLNGNSQVKDNKIDLLVQQYEQFTILEEESIDSGFARVKRNVTTIEESKDLPSLARTIALKAKKESTDDETLTSGSDDEEYAMAVCLRTCLEPDEWIKDSGCSKHMTGNKSLFSTYKAYNGGNAVFGSNLKGKIIGKDYYSEDQYAVSIKKIWRIRACTHQRPQKIKDQYAVSRGLNTPYSRYGINIIFWKISNVVPTPRNPQYAVKMDNPNITMEEYIRLEEEKAHRHGKVYNWKTATYDKIWDNEDVHDLGSVETEFPAIVFNDTLTSEALLCEPTVSSLNDEIDFRISFDESDDEDCTIFYTAYPNSMDTAYPNPMDTAYPVWTLSSVYFQHRPREGNIDEYWWRIYESGNLEVLES
ncbi:hypothetical protein Tco_1509604 [Tanacetum coccineum]